MNSVTAGETVETTLLLSPRKRKSKAKVPPHPFVAAADADDPYCAKCPLVEANEVHDLGDFELVWVTHTVRQVRR